MEQNWDGKDRRNHKNNKEATITFNLKEYLETEYLDKIKSAMPCSVHAERMRGIKGQINWLWFLVGGIFLGLVGVVFSMVK